MKIYTKTGDQGLTGLYGGERVPKNHLRIDTYGTLDELNACLGLVLASQKTSQTLKKRLTRIQSELFSLGGELATPKNKILKGPLLNEDQILGLEQEIDEMEKTLPSLKTFILPGGTLQGAYLHLARTICRRAERKLITLHQQEPLRAEVLKYLNRLADYLFVLARFVNHQAKAKETPWISTQALKL